MIDHGVGNASQLVAGKTHTPAEVYLLHVREKVFVETSAAAVYTRPDHQACARRPVHVYRGIVLTAVCLALVENTAATERISVAVQKPATGTCIFEALLILVCQ